jgi:hydroxyethylthiazole kinase-like uncharacterized protein yjeF
MSCASSGASRVLTARQARALDRRALDAYGISTLVLMENAGRQIAAEAVRCYQGRKRIAVFCGKGNNGGDGFVAARHLLAQGIRPDVYLAGRISEARNEARANLDILLKLKTKVIEVLPDSVSLIKTAPYGLIVDALLGIGLTGEVRGVYGDLIALINASKARVLSVDIPSGLDAATGRALGQCVHADRTVTFVALKRGMTVHDGPRACGAVTIADLGIPLTVCA